jgi:hypothetical protein
MKEILMTDEDREFMSKIAMVLIEDRMIFKQLAESLESLADKGLPFSAFRSAADMLRMQAAKIDDVLGVRNS